MAALPAFPPIVWLNGELTAPEEARISVFDRGFLFGDGIYEVMARMGGQFFYEQLHWERLERCLDQIGLKANVNTLKTAVPGLLAASGLEDKDCLLYIQVTRGVAPRQHAFPKGIAPTLMMYAWEKTLPAIPEKPVRVVMREEFRWSRCDIKTTSLLGNVMANEFAMEHDCYETVFMRQGVVTEASHCNVFFVRNGAVITHPANPYILDGITRQVVLKLCAQLGLQVRLVGYPASEIHLADEAFLTGTSTQITAIGQIDYHVLGNGAVGGITRRLQEAFLEEKLKAFGV